MSIIAVVGNKGGAGKTTISVNLASGINKRYRTAIIDADPQRSSLQWRAFSESDAVSVYEAEEDIQAQASKLKDKYEIFGKGLKNARLDQERRSLRLSVNNLKWSFDKHNKLLKLSFFLPAGGYATSVLRELVKV